jgi:hypothetical protein
VTDIKNHLASALGDEPPMIDDLDAVMTAGRGQLRRRTGWLTVAGTAGAAALATAVVVPIVASSSSGQPTKVVSQSTPKPAVKGPVKCNTYFVAIPSGASDRKAVARAKAKVAGPDGKSYVERVKHDGGKKIEAVSSCPNPLKATKSSGPSGPKYHYTEAPATVAHRLASTLASDVAAQNLTVVFSTPFAQESSTLEKGRPSYFDGNVDVKVGSTLGDIGVQVNHPTTAQQPLTGKCDGTGFAMCQRKTLSNGAVLQTDQVKVGHGTYIVEAQVSRPDGTLVHVQESNYAFGPEATKAYGDQPLPLSALVTMAEESAYSF